MAIRLTKVTAGDVNQHLVGIYEMNIMAPDNFQAILPDAGDTDFDEFYDDEDEFNPEDWEEEEIVTIRRKKLVYPGFPVWALVLIIGGGIVVLTGVVLLIVLLLRKKKKAAQAAAQAHEGETPDIFTQE